MQRLDHARQLMLEQIPALRRYARALTAGSVAPSEDLVQECLTRALGRLHLWRAQGEMRPWLFAIMHNLFVNQVVRAQRQPVLVDIESVPESQGSADTVPTVELGRMEEALRSLPASQREVLVLVGLEEFSYEEAARALGVPVGTVMSRLSRARQRMRDVMSEAAGPALKRVK